DTARYSCKGSPACRRVKIGGDAKNFFNYWNASSHLFVQLNLSPLFSVAKKWKAFSPAQDKNLDRAVIRPVSCCTSFTDVGLLISIMA
ncbi:hypothetical protein A2U01_0056792, partial [Trifolium medium]|nr:hypothetical protein [Trifolium medium]